MGFFSDLKEDLSQAVNELIPEEPVTEETTKPTDEEQAEESVSLDELLKNIDDIELPPDEGEAVASGEGTSETVQSEDDGLSDTMDATWDLESMLENALAESDTTAGETVTAEATIEEEAVPHEETIEKSEGEVSMETGETRVAIDETSIITGGMTIKGDICSEGSLEVIGGVNGNIDILGKLNITGHINGNSKAAEIFAEGAKINGEIISEGAVKIGTSTVIVGNITASSAAIAGAVKGDIDVKGPVILDASAIVMGNIKSKSVQINNGAVIEGMCSQCYADVNPTSFFEDYKMETSKGKNK
ncbi:MAG: polymer-forming cytoskeletal protein [Acetatifactor sp.]|nr:polymer-forming cytoskeletal protein [Acetatifactor sp.]